MMTLNSRSPRFSYHADNNLYYCEGDWSILVIGDLYKEFKQSTIPANKTLTISGAKLSKFDSAGALTLMHCLEELKKHDNYIIELKDFSAEQKDLFSLVDEKKEFLTYSPHQKKVKKFLYWLGEQTTHKYKQARGLLYLVGNISEKLFAAFKDYRRFQFPSIIANINATGITALPIIGLLSFLIGVVLAYQMGLQLETYGANIFIAYISGMAIFREFAPLITAIIVAGRTSSAFTAQIGSMKINEEIDALNTMGLSVTELLVVPKVLGLIIIFPLLIFWADFFSTIGAMIMSKLMLHVGYREFLSRLQESVGLKQMMLGLYKAPTFAVLIALVGCYQGFCVELNADSLGKQTTKSVVQALFLIIVADAAYSVIYSWMNL
jgi:phospholipid/cholesterol/gamma-HCH transport system permease protein